MFKPSWGELGGRKLEGGSKKGAASLAKQDSKTSGTQLYGELKGKRGS